MANYKRGKSRYQYKCSICNKSRAATLNGDLNKKDLKNKEKVKEQLKEFKEKEIRNDRD